MKNWAEIAPALLVSLQKSSNPPPKLETIEEEGGSRSLETMHKRTTFLLPLIVSMVFYFLLYKEVNWCRNFFHERWESSIYYLATWRLEMENVNNQYLNPQGDLIPFIVTNIMNFVSKVFFKNFTIIPFAPSLKVIWFDGIKMTFDET